MQLVQRYIEGLFYTCPANFFFLCIGIAIFEERWGGTSSRIQR
jgi:hypothetical protein